MARMQRDREQSLELKIEQAEARVAKTRAAHDKAVDELKKLYDIQKARRNEEILKAIESSKHSYEEILAFIKNPDAKADEDDE